MISGLFVSLRPKQWAKNALLFGGLIFAFKLGDPRLLGLSLAGFLVFCALSSAMYLINDIADVDKDRQHPLKKRRPLAAGIIRPVHAGTLSAILLAIFLPTAFWLGTAFGLAALAYIVLALAYSSTLKHIVIIDVFSLSAGFVLRAVAGALVIDVPISPWLYLCTILGALFIALSKRRHELLLLNDQAAHHRRILAEYSPYMLDQMINIVTSTTVIAYSLYTFFADNLPKNHAMMVTIPFVLYGIFRYLYLIHRKDAGGSPEDVLLRDRPLLVDIVLWTATSVGVLYVFRGQ